MTASQATEVDLAEESGIPLRLAYKFINKQAGGRESLGYFKQDQKNYLRTVRQKRMAYEEVGVLLQYFSKQILENPSFFYELHLDKEEQITNIFWADAKMIIDYSHFGDVVSFDTTYKVNELDRPFAVFVGFNHHKEIVVFGAALMYDETAASFSWLFKTFLKAMSSKAPRTIFTDQDPVMAKAILEVMPQTYHRLSLWHLMQNACKNLNTLFRGEEGVHNALTTKFDHIEEESEFAAAWYSMLDEYDAHENDWLATTFKIRKKWAYAYVRSAWSIGIRSAQISESFNARLKNYLKSDLNIVQFFTNFERVLTDTRYKEWEAEYDLQFRIAHVKFDIKMLKQAREVYTKAIFKLFQDQFEESIELSITKCVADGDDFVYTVKLDDKSKKHKVKKEGISTVSCNCRLFEMKGILCSHAIKVLREAILNNI
ncbi:protein FAR1-RELATED SEQUENCE 5-like [Pyrus communis]|uniref:protein FAR1-RELATED SEQUENCE 5-like n=1 Tax=Pyrus communis TaxID=23211 RepID=UPI0035C1846C